MDRSQSLEGKLLIAMPSLNDPNFERSVLFICSHNEDGALGLVINQAHPASMQEVLDQLGLDWGHRESAVVYQGGPVAVDRGFVLYEGLLDVPGYLKVAENLYLGTNPDTLRHLVEGSSTGRFLFALGYSGWASGQLEMELKENAWLVSGLNRHILFETPINTRWESALKGIGVDPVKLVDWGSHMTN
ncbi:MAG: YqgE/AlgH family protein [Magnetococcales bacterium]|nr:YqgE/AlgH family protein [Magnetococcales bacterium]